jgi:predicted pyridoxine 5'-phosphate oxidase superfamily flavin-nucleotide-binding protein
MTGSPDTEDRAPAGLSLGAIGRCFGGAVPAVLATAGADGMPNITYLSRAHPVDDHRIALSNQFMSKTSRNLASNPRASLLLIDPVTYDEYRLALVYERTERRGPVFDRLRADIEALATLTGMQDVFRLRAANVFRVDDIVRIEPNQTADDAVDAWSQRDRSRDLAGLADLVACVARAPELDIALDIAMDALDRRFGYEHAYLLLVDETGTLLFTIASRGYGAMSLGAETAIGDGLVGTVATRCEPVRSGGLRQLAKYSQSIRRRYEAAGVRAGHEPTLPRLPDANSRIAVPAMSSGELVGVLVVESAHRAAFDDADEHLLLIVAALLAGIVARGRDDPFVDTGRLGPAAPTPPTTRTSVVRFFAVDGSIFVDGEYLIKGVAGRILWSLLEQHAASGRTDFTNKELRLDATLDLPGFKDNLESRLLLLRRRLDERNAPIAITPTGRGRFRLDVRAKLVLERATG